VTEQPVVSTPPAVVMTSGGRGAITPSQTVGPFLHLALADPADAFAVPTGTPGAFWIRGTVVDGDGAPVTDALVETWQAGADGTFPGAGPAGPNGFTGFGRCATDDDGAWAVHTVRPGPVPAADGRPAAPHVAVSVFARGLLDRVVTRLYFADETEANATDPVLGALPDPDRAVTLLAAPCEDGYRFDIRLQGPDETVFFDL